METQNSTPRERMLEQEIERLRAALERFTHDDLFDDLCRAEEPYSDQEFRERAFNSGLWAAEERINELARETLQGGDEIRRLTEIADLLESEAAA